MGAQPVLSSPGWPELALSPARPSFPHVTSSRDCVVADSYPTPGTLKPSVIAGLPAAWATRGRLQRAG